MAEAVREKVPGMQIERGDPDVSHGIAIG